MSWRLGSTTGVGGRVGALVVVLPWEPRLSLSSPSSSPLGPPSPCPGELEERKARSSSRRMNRRLLLAQVAT